MSPASSAHALPLLLTALQFKGSALLLVVLGALLVRLFGLGLRLKGVPLGADLFHILKRAYSSVQKIFI